MKKEFIEALREADFDVISVGESYIGSADDEILQIALNEKAIIMTYDTDFGELVFRFSLESNGVILLRLHGLPLTEKTEKTIEVLLDHADELENVFTVISEKSVRIKKNL